MPLTYNAQIDGLRALAVIPVVLYHAGFATFSGGFVGVDIFFVISGYLITGILLEDLENKCFSLSGFYERRARRLLPALFFITGISVCFAIIYFPPHALKDLGQSIFATSLFISNLFFYLESDYFNNIADTAPFAYFEFSS